MIKRIFILIVSFALLSFPLVALAEQSGPDQATVVNENQKVESVLLFGKNAVIAGEVTDEVVIVYGNLTLAKTAKVHDRVFIFGGEITQEKGAEVGKGIIHINPSSQYVDSILLGVGAFLALELGKLALAILIVLVSIVAWLLFKGKVERGKVLLETNLLKIGLIGLLLTLGSVLAIIALGITIIGIPAAILLAIIILLFITLGLSALSLLAGEFLTRGMAWGNKSLVQLLSGAVFIIAFLNLPLVGLLLGILVCIISYGAVFLSLLPKTS